MRLLRPLLSVLLLVSLPVCLSVLADDPPSAYAPSRPDCENGPMAAFPICDWRLAPFARAADLVSRLTLVEKINLLGDTSWNITRLGLPNYEWWNEALHGVAQSPGVTFRPFNSSLPLNNATSFPMPIGLGASFDLDLYRLIGSAISTEVRVFNNYNQSGLTLFTPNINFFRSPNWGRGQETVGEDIYLGQEYVTALVESLQGTMDEDPRYLKTVATAKHFFGYDLEDWDGVPRMRFDAIISELDMTESYLPIFQTAVQEAHVTSVMCSYNSVNGVPSCANEPFLQGVLRDSWGFDGYVVSDCMAINFIYRPYHNYTKSWDATMADALHAGVDLECGTSYQQHALQAVQNGAVAEATIDTRLLNSYTQLIRTGYFDPVDMQPYAQLDDSLVSSVPHQRLALRAAVESVILLQNQGDYLPLAVPAGAAPGSVNVAVIGPNAHAPMTLLGNYNGIPPYIFTPYTGMVEVNSVHLNGSLTIQYAPGCAISGTDTSQFQQALDVAQNAKYVVFVGGIDGSLESEGMDRTDLQWPTIQVKLVQALLTLGKPLVLVSISGGGIDYTPFLNQPYIPAILHMAYGGQAAGVALSEILYGLTSPSGRLPITIYPSSYLSNEVPTDMALRANFTARTLGRTYRFFLGQPVFPFGFGLSYTQFAYTALKSPPASSSSTALRARLRPTQVLKHRQVARNLPALHSSSAVDADVTWDAQSRHLVIDLDRLPLSPAESSGGVGVEGDVLVYGLYVNVTNEGRVTADDSILMFSTPSTTSVASPSDPTPPLRQLVGFERVFALAPGATQTVFFPVQLKDLATTDVKGRRKVDSGSFTLTVGVPSQIEIKGKVTGKTLWLK